VRIIGLTGSIGMGKSTTLRLFAEVGCATWDADAAVHRLYAPGGGAVDPVEERFPGVTAPDGGVDRERLVERLQADPSGFTALEAIVHPLVRDDRAAWLETARAEGRAFAVVDVPLLFETGAHDQVEAVVVVSTGHHEQRRRVLSRPGMTPERLEHILARQTPDDEKRRRADFVIETGDGEEAAREQVRAVLAALSTPGWRSRRPDALHSGGERGE
jgi:dephospho-CoA kinase